MKWENTKELIELAQKGDKKAKEQIVVENAPLVKSIVKRYLNRGCDYDDLYQVGLMGLLKAISGFDLTFDVRFSTYAVPMICGEVKRFIRDNNSVKMSRSLKELQQKIRYARQKLSVKLNRDPGIKELAEETGATVEDVLLALESMQQPRSLDEPIFDESGSTLKEVIEDNKIKASLNDKLALHQCIAQLEEREKRIILLRYFKDMTQTKIADIMGISQVQISRIESRVLDKLRRKLG